MDANLNRILQLKENLENSEIKCIENQQKFKELAFNMGNSPAAKKIIDSIKNRQLLSSQHSVPYLETPKSAKVEVR